MHETKTVEIKGVKIGGGHPIVIQSMTNTNTEDPIATAKQCMELADAGSELVRITVNNEDAAKAVPEIRKILDQEGYTELPLVGDFHYNGHTLLTDFPECAKILDKYRINPGNVGFGDKHNYNFATICQIAAKHKKAVRIGVNWGSLDRELLTEMMDLNSKSSSPKTDREVIIDAMVESAVRSTKLAEDSGLEDIILSVKMSEVNDMVKAYELLAAKNLGYPLHLGLTEAGSGMKGLVSSAAALSILLNQHIGDTIRISLTPAPGQPRSAEVKACKTLLQSLDLRHFSPQVTSCPGCGRTESTFFQELAAEVNKHINQKLPTWQSDYPKVKNLKIAVMGCIVNGPGESQHADIGISLPGKGETPDGKPSSAPVYIKGKFHKTLTAPNIPGQFIELLEQYVKDNC